MRAARQWRQGAHTQPGKRLLFNHIVKARAAVGATGQRLYPGNNTNIRGARYHRQQGALGLHILCPAAPRESGQGSTTRQVLNLIRAPTTWRNCRHSLPRGQGHERNGPCNPGPGVSVPEGHRLSSRPLQQLCPGMRDLCRGVTAAGTGQSSCPRAMSPSPTHISPPPTA